jgi:hypothetical protein
VHIGNLIRGSYGLSCMKLPGPCVSRYNANYSCSVSCVSTDGVFVQVSFECTGDGSLGDLQNPSNCALRLFQDKLDTGQKSFLLSDKSKFQLSSNTSSGILVYELPAYLQFRSSPDATSSLSRYLVTPQSNSAVTKNYVMWTSVALAKVCSDLVAELLSGGALFSLILKLDSSGHSNRWKTEQPTNFVDSTRVVMAIVAKLRHQNNFFPIAPFFTEVTDALALGKEQSAASLDFATALLSAAAPGAFILSRHALSTMNSYLHPHLHSLLPPVCLVTLPDWVFNATSPHSCVFMPLFFAGRPIIVMPNFGWADIIVANAPKRVSIPCACIVAALLSPDACPTIARLSDETGLPQTTVSECMQLLLNQNACVFATQANEPSYRLRDATDWSLDGWVVLNHLSLKASCSFLSSDYAAICHWFDFVATSMSLLYITFCFRYAVALSTAPALDFCESVCECSFILSLPHAHVTYAVSRMTRERVLALSHGYVCEFSRLASINFSSLPLSSLTASDSSMLPQLTGPLSLFKSLVLVKPEAHTMNEPMPYSNSLTNAISLTVPDFKAEITRTVLSTVKKVGGDIAQFSGKDWTLFRMLCGIVTLFVQPPSWL